MKHVAGRNRKSGDARSKNGLAWALKVLRSPFFFLIPFLAIGVMVVIQSNEVFLWGDEGRYYDYAYNLTRGYYSPPAPNINLVSGPGYPVILAPMAALDLPLLYWRLLNPLMFYLGMVFVFYSLRIYHNYRTSLVWTLIISTVMLYLNRNLHIIYSENLTILVGNAAIWLFLKGSQKPGWNWANLFGLGLLLAFLTLTKVIFGYVLTASIVLAMLTWLIFRRQIYARFALIAFVALLFCTPYLYYTWSLTGKFFLWSDYSGDNLYWMTTPIPEEVGNWQNYLDAHHPYHQEFFASIDHLYGGDRDAAIRAKAIENIRNHPKKYLINWIGNLERMFLNFPFSYRMQKPSFMFIPGMFILVFTLLMLYPTIRYFRKIPKEIFALLFLYLIYLGGTSLVAANTRQVFVFYSIFGIWFAYMTAHFIRINRGKPTPQSSNSPA